MLGTLATLGYNWQLPNSLRSARDTGNSGLQLVTRQLTEDGAGDAGNTGLQQATAGNSTTQNEVVEMLATVGYNWQLLATHWRETLATLDYYN